jgi:excisionase family DNA binding protein
MEPVTLRVNDAGSALGLSRSKVYDLIAAGKLEAVKLGGRTLVTASSIRALVDASPRMEAA